MIGYTIVLDHASGSIDKMGDSMNRKKISFIAVALLLSLNATLCTSCEKEYGDETEEYRELVSSVESDRNETKDDPAADDVLRGSFSKHFEYTDKDGNTVNSLPFWFYTPAEANEATPLIVVLHNSLVKFDPALTVAENLDNMSNTEKSDFTGYLLNNQMGNVPAYILMPQTDGSSRGWAKRGAELIELIDYCKREYGISAERVNMLGYSMGGTGAIELAVLYPHAFGKIVSVAGGLDGVTNSTRPWTADGARYELNESYSQLKVPKEGTDSEYESETMKYLYETVKEKYTAATQEEMAAATDFMEKRVAAAADALKQNEIKLWLIASTNDVEVEYSVSKAIADAAGEEYVHCDIITGYSHSKMLEYAQQDYEEIISFLTK